MLLVVAATLFGLSVFGLRGLLDIHDALRFAELDRLGAPAHWQLTRVWIGAVAAVPVFFAASALANGAWLAAAAVAGLGYAVAPRFLASARQRVEHDLLDDLALHLDLIALGLEAGRPLPAALATCAHRAPDGALRRAWSRVVLDIHSGAEPLEALRAMEQRMGFAPVAALVAALRAAEKLSIPAALVFRERARQSAAQRFARAERRARAAPLKLWAALVLCIAPCTMVVLAFPLARLLMKLVD
ncbi:MAG TPA: type II secretion system F family protein [Burkholderiales bacterium]|nr:type II secretion system F family protein [Burkholderiales bacterium]